MAKKVNHVVVNGETIVDLRNDNVTPEAMVPGTTAHNAAGEQITGTYVPPVTSVNGKTGDVTLTKSDVGLGNVPNKSTNNQTPTYTAATTLAGLTSGEKLSVAMGKIAKAITDLISHIANKDNPHSVTAAQAGAATTDHNHSGRSISPTSIELFPGASAGNGGYIDFHYNNSSDDYTSRLIESPSGKVKLNGNTIFTTANIIALLNVNVTFTNGIATYENSAITASSVTFVQWRAGAVSTLTDSVLSTTPQNGSMIIVAKIGFTGGPLPVNILIINKN